MNYYSHHIGDFDRATRHLTRIERSVYLDLIFTYYDTEQPLTSDMAALCRKIVARNEEEKAAVKAVLNEFFTATPTGWYHDRCEDEIDSYRKSNTQKSVAGKASAAARALRRQQAINGGSTSVPTPVERACNGTPTNQEPITINQDIKALVPSMAEDVPRPGKPECPHQEIIRIYHEVLPQCPAVRDWTPARATQLRARWNESPDRQNLDYWRGLFQYVAGCDFLVGRTSKPFFADLEFITKSNNFTKIREGKYENR